MLHCLLDTYTRNASGADGRKVPLSKDEPVTIMGEKQLSTSDVWNFYTTFVCLSEKDKMMILLVFY
jgi:hypothetical protein